jgi:hypothetical protein
MESFFWRTEHSAARLEEFKKGKKDTLQGKVNV